MSSQASAASPTSQKRRSNSKGARLSAPPGVCLPCHVPGCLGLQPTHVNTWLCCKPKRRTCYRSAAAQRSRGPRYRTWLPVLLMAWPACRGAAAAGCLPKRHWSGWIVVPYLEAHAAQILRLILRLCKGAYAAATPGQDWRQKDLYVGTDVEFGVDADVEAEYGGPCAAVVQFALAGFVAVIPLQVLTWWAPDTPPEERAVTVRRCACSHAPASHRWPIMAPCCAAQARPRPGPSFDQLPPAVNPCG